mgnify:CR=1 FL=1
MALATLGSGIDGLRNKKIDAEDIYSFKAITEKWSDDATAIADAQVGYKGFT